MIQPKAYKSYMVMIQGTGFPLILEIGKIRGKKEFDCRFRVRVKSAQNSRTKNRTKKSVEKSGNSKKCIKLTVPGEVGGGRATNVLGIAVATCIPVAG
jgi:hypothetical protein